MESDKLNTSYQTNASFLGRERGGTGLQRINDDGAIAEQNYLIPLGYQNPVDVTLSQVAVDGTGRVVGTYFWSPNLFHIEFDSTPSIDLADLRLLIRVDKQIMSYDQQGKSNETVLALAPSLLPTGKIAFHWQEATTDQLLFPLNSTSIKLGFAFMYKDQIGKAEIQHPFTLGLKLFTPKVMLNL